jgi:sulfite exporter TauE/SafE
MNGQTVALLIIANILLWLSFAVLIINYATLAFNGALIPDWYFTIIGAILVVAGVALIKNLLAEDFNALAEKIEEIQNAYDAINQALEKADMPQVTS